MDLQSVPIEILLAEIGRRCKADARAAAPAWAMPALETVSDFEAVCVADLLEMSGRGAHAVRLRQMSMALIRITSRRSLPEIGALFGQTHGNVLWAINKIEQNKDTDPAFRARWHNMVGEANAKALRRSSRHVPAGEPGESAHSS